MIYTWTIAFKFVIITFRLLCFLSFIGNVKLSPLFKLFSGRSFLNARAFSMYTLLAQGIELLIPKPQNLRNFSSET